MNKLSPHLDGVWSHTVVGFDPAADPLRFQHDDIDAFLPKGLAAAKPAAPAPMTTTSAL